MHSHPTLRSRVFVPMLLSVVIGSSAVAADMNGGRAGAAARYEVERATCLRGESGQDVTTCLREAAAAYEQAKRGRLDEDSSQLVANRFQRCDRLPDEQRRACIARMQGEGTTSGSVAGGGILRELVIVVD